MMWQLQFTIWLCYILQLSIVVTAQAQGAIVIGKRAMTVLQGNDDGFGAAYIRALYWTLKDAGYIAAISAPANDMSGSGSRDAPAEPLTSESDYGLLPEGSPAIGTDAYDEYIHYVNSYPVTAIKFGISTVGAEELGGKPDIVLTGINHGNNLGVAAFVSGTIGAANEALKEDVPAIAFSAPGSQRSYLDLTSNDVAYTYSKVAVKIVDTLKASGPPYLPAGVGLNVNFNDAAPCTLETYIFVLTRLHWNPLRKDVHQCNSVHLPTESSVMSGGPCRASISVFKQGSKLDADAAEQEVVRDKLSGILECV